MAPFSDRSDGHPWPNLGAFGICFGFDDVPGRLSRASSYLVNDEGRALGRGLDADFSATDQKVVLTVAVARYEAMFDDRVPVF